jgi:hypothetical protein
MVDAFMALTARLVDHQRAGRDRSAIDRPRAGWRKVFRSFCGAGYVPWLRMSPMRAAQGQQEQNRG